MLYLEVTFRSAQRKLEIQQPMIIIGRSRDAHILLPVGTIARHHARILDEDGRIWLEDMRSTNGTWIEGEETNSWLRSTERVQLRIHQTFNVGLQDEGARITIANYAPVIDPDFDQGFEAPFLSMLATNSSDDEARAVYADALEENGIHDRAEWLRIAIALQSDPNNSALIERQRSLGVLLNTAPRWLALVSRK
jgi:uncharacterized protein (TIGR02996 family)